jgi:hypothetical protein
LGSTWEATAGFFGAKLVQSARHIPTVAASARLIGATGRRRLTHVLIGTPMDTRMKSNCSRSSNAREILGSRSSQLDDTNANRDANRHHRSCDIDPQEPQMMKLR